MRVVWKDVLASLVEGRKPGEETTLWIQREVINAISGKAELEALHQIPIKVVNFGGIFRLFDRSSIFSQSVQCGGRISLQMSRFRKCAKLGIDVVECS